jgi:CRP/FNR family transcriptional regulator
MEASPGLQSILLFAGLEARDLKRLEAIVVLQVLERGESLFFEGELSEGFFAVAEGLIKVYKVAPEGREQVLHLVGPGQTFAEASLFGDGRYPASAEAAQPSRLWLIPKGPFLKFLQADPEVSIKLLASMATWLKRLSHLVETLSLKNVEARLAQYLLARAHEECRLTEEGLVLALDSEKKMIAARLGTISETLSRSLKKLKDKGLIREEGSNILITDLEGLRELAEG